MQPMLPVSFLTLLASASRSWNLVLFYFFGHFVTVLQHEMYLLFSFEFLGPPNRYMQYEAVALTVRLRYCCGKVFCLKRGRGRVEMQSRDERAMKISNLISSRLAAPPLVLFLPASPIGTIASSNPISRMSVPYHGWESPLSRRHSPASV